MIKSFCYVVINSIIILAGTTLITELKYDWLVIDLFKLLKKTSSIWLISYYTYTVVFDTFWN